MSAEKRQRSRRGTAIDSSMLAPSPAQNALPPLLRCTSTPISASAHELNKMLGLDTEAHMAFSGAFFGEKDPIQKRGKTNLPKKRLSSVSESKARSMEHLNFSEMSDCDSGIHTMSTNFSQNSLDSTAELDSTVPLDEGPATPPKSAKLKSTSKISSPAGVKTRTSPRFKKPVSYHVEKSVSRRRFSYKAGHFMGKN